MWPTNRKEISIFLFNPHKTRQARYCITNLLQKTLSCEKDYVLLCLPVLVLAAAVVGMEDEVRFSQAVVLQVVVEKGDNTVTPLPHVHPLINEVVDLLEKVCDVLCR